MVVVVVMEHWWGHCPHYHVWKEYYFLISFSFNRKKFARMSVSTNCPPPPRLKVTLARKTNVSRAWESSNRCVRAKLSWMYNGYVIQRPAPTELILNPQLSGQETSVWVGDFEECRPPMHLAADLTFSHVMSSKSYSCPLPWTRDSESVTVALGTLWATGKPVQIPFRHHVLTVATESNTPLPIISAGVEALLEAPRNLVTTRARFTGAIFLGAVTVVSVLLLARQWKKSKSERTISTWERVGVLVGVVVVLCMSFGTIVFGASDLLMTFRSQAGEQQQKQLQASSMWLLGMQMIVFLILAVAMCIVLLGRSLSRRRQ